jgi:hypothetical protein
MHAGCTSYREGWRSQCQHEARSRAGGDEHPCVVASRVGTADGGSSAAGGFVDHPLPIVAERLDAKLDDRQRDDLLEADRAGR